MGTGGESAVAKNTNRISRYWFPKIERNRARDRLVNRRLKESGWRVIRFWEREILRDPTHCASQVSAIG